MGLETEGQIYQKDFSGSTDISVFAKGRNKWDTIKSYALKASGVDCFFQVQEGYRRIFENDRFFRTYIASVVALEVAFCEVICPSVSLVRAKFLMEKGSSNRTIINTTDGLCFFATDILSNLSCGLSALTIYDHTNNSCLSLGTYIGLRLAINMGQHYFQDRSMRINNV